MLPSHRCALELQSQLLGEAMHEDAKERPAGEAVQLRIPQLTRAQVVELLKAACSRRPSLHVGNLAVPQAKALAEAASLLQCPEVLSLADARLAAAPVWYKEGSSLGTMPEYSQALRIHQWAHEQGLSQFETASARFIVQHLTEVAEHTAPGRAFLLVLKKLAEDRPVSREKQARLLDLMRVINNRSFTQDVRSELAEVDKILAMQPPIKG